MITITALGTPVPDQSGRFIRGRFVNNKHTNRRLQMWINAIASACKEVALENAMPTGPIVAIITFTFPTKDRKRWGHLHDKMRDRDNLIKPVMDAITRSKVIGDDGQVADGPITKRWGEIGGVVIRLSRENEDQPDESDQTGYKDAHAKLNDKPDWLS